MEMKNKLEAWRLDWMRQNNNQWVRRKRGRNHCSQTENKQAKKNEKRWGQFKSPLRQYQAC